MGATHAKIDLPTPPALTGEDQARAMLYGLLAGILSAPPATRDLEVLAGLSGDATPLGRAIDTLARIARSTSPAAAAEEFQDLFIGIGRGEVVPYGSYYLTGFLHEKPLARLRTDLEAMGLARPAGLSEPEDHIASVLEVMAGLIDGRFGEAEMATQKAFFERHIAGWAGHLFDDLAKAKSAVLYGAVGLVGAAFLAIEVAALTMVEEP